MRVIQLTAENVKKLKAIEITPKTDLVEIAGRNDQGKTTVLDCIWWALAGTRAIQSKPIRKGQTKAKIRLDLGELIVERRFTDKGSSLIVETVDGARYTSPQNVLDELVGALSFDPLAFARMTAAEQYAALVDILGLADEIAAIDGQRRGAYEKRTDENRDAKGWRSRAEGIVVDTGETLPETPINTATLMDQLTHAASANLAAGEHETLGQRFREAVERVEALVRTHQESLETAKRALTDWAESPVPARVDAEALRAELDGVEATNRKIELVKQRSDMEATAAEHEAAAERLTEKIEGLDKKKHGVIGKAKLPVDNLALGEGEVLLEDVPFEQAGTAEQLRVSLALAMHANPKLRVIRITEGSLLDREHMDMIAIMAKDEDYQVWIERVDATGKIGIMIEDGEVVADNQLGK